MECALALDNHRAMAERVNPDRKEVAYRLRLLRRSFGYEIQADWVRFLAIPGLTASHWNNWETADVVPISSYARQISLKTGALTDWIYWGDRAGLTIRVATLLDERERKDREEQAAKPTQPPKERKPRRHRG